MGDRAGINLSSPRTRQDKEAWKKGNCPIITISSNMDDDDDDDDENDDDDDDDDDDVIPGYFLNCK